ncbi:Nicotinamidase [Fusarium oxysporum f. sp. albedinis]|nr:Nicotinamidase [Fusarium oxysporum f. sp. albedinis]
MLITFNFWQINLLCEAEADCRYLCLKNFQEGKLMAVHLNNPVLSPGIKMTRHPEVPIRDTVICLFECFVDVGHSLSKPLGVFVVLLLRYEGPVRCHCFDDFRCHRLNGTFGRSSPCTLGDYGSRCFASCYFCCHCFPCRGCCNFGTNCFFSNNG